MAPPRRSVLIARRLADDPEAGLSDLHESPHILRHTFATRLGMAGVNATTIADLNEARGHTMTWGVAACDLNGDAVPDLLSSSYGRAANHLWQGGADGRFTNRSLESGYARDDDYTWQDNEFAKCFCQGTPNAPGCDEVGQPRVNCGQPNWNIDDPNQS